jgi:hypothetical protein
MTNNLSANHQLLLDIKQIVEQARGQVKQTVNSASLLAYRKVNC